jgi:acetoin utilization protein AcuB
MTRDVLTVPPWLPIADAWRILSRERIRHLPVVEHGRLVGILSDRDLLLAGTADDKADDLVFPNETVGTILTPRPITCNPATTVAEAARIMIDKKIDALPVVSGVRLIGLVTSTDLLMLLLERAPECALPFDFRVAEATLVA